MILKKYGNKIKREDDINNTIGYYNDYINNNEIYMIDIYNEIGSKYLFLDNNLNNLYNVYFKIYFFNLTKENINNIIDFINKEKKMN